MARSGEGRADRSVGRIDLHLHTRYSDGTLSAAEIVREAAARGVGLLAITDHDTTEGLTEAVAAGREARVTVIPGVELAADSAAHDIHLLGYYVDWGSREFQSALAQLSAGREARTGQILERLRALHLPLEMARVRELSGAGSVGRPHIAAAMVEARYAVSQGDAFRRYLGRGRPAFVPRPKLQLAEANRIIAEAGGVAVLAHPAKIGSWEKVREAIACGVQGVEVFHTDHSERDTESLLAFAQEHALLVTGGTDSHGPRSDLATPIGGVEIPAWVGEAFLARAPEWWRRRPEG